MKDATKDERLALKEVRKGIERGFCESKWVQEERGRNQGSRFGEMKAQSSYIT